jgi:Flp pilus assembly pilin Flp
MDALMFAYCYIKNLFNKEEGQDLIEYALIIAVFVIVAIIGLQLLGPEVTKIWTKISGFLQAGAGAGG